EAAMQEHRQRKPRVVAVMRSKVGGGVELAEVKFLAMTHAVMALARAHAGEHDEIDAVRPDGPVGERADEVVASGRGSQLQAHDAIQLLRSVSWHGEFGLLQQLPHVRSKTSKFKAALES